MSYMKELDIKVKETIDKIIGVVARYFPESESRDGEWEAEIAYLVYDLAERIIKWKVE